ncbi:MAG: hypothetical protein GY906_18615 [bacterium]|nr:hypothetical protein [bacterium]
MERRPIELRLWHESSRPVALLCVGLLLTAGWVRAASMEIGPADDLESAINQLDPGEELVLQGGTYVETDRLSVTVFGTVVDPITIRAKDGETPVITYINDSQNVMNIENSQYLVLHGVEITGGSAGIRITNSNFITISDCHLHDTGDVAISANTPGSSYQGLQLLRNHIHDTNVTGEGMYLGCNSDACRIFDSLIEGNYIHHTNGPTVVQGDGIEIKEGSYNNIVRDNVIHDTHYPCLLTGSTVGNGAPNLLERNVMWNCGDNGIQAAADAVIRNNIVLSSVGPNIRSHPHQNGVPENLEIVHNTLLNPSGDGIYISSISGSVVIANNAVFSPQGWAIRVSGDLAQLVVTGNVGDGGVSGVTSGFDDSGDVSVDLVLADLSGAPPEDVFPAPGSLLVGNANPLYLVQDDFNGRLRYELADVGAYRYSPSGNPGWTIAAEPKPVPEPSIFEDGFESGDTSAWAP